MKLVGEFFYTIRSESRRPRPIAQTSWVTVIALGKAEDLEAKGAKSTVDAEDVWSLGSCTYKTFSDKEFLEDWRSVSEVNADVLADFISRASRANTSSEGGA